MQHSMKIVIVQGAFLPVPPLQAGAVEKIWYKMGLEFSRLGHEVVHISKQYPGLPDDDVTDGVHNIRIRGYKTPKRLLKLKWLDLLYTRRVLRVLPKDADVIVANTFWLPVLATGKVGRKIYVSVQRVPKGQIWFYRHIGQIAANSTLILNKVKAELPTRFHYKASCISNPIPFEIEERLAPKENILLYVGRLHPEKGLTTLIKAFRSIPDPIRKDWRLSIIGPHLAEDGGGGSGYLKELENAASGDRTIDFVGPIFSSDELVKHYAQSRIFCYPIEEWSGDSSPIAPKEAMAYGAVPVVSRHQSFGDYVIDGVSGLSYDHLNGTKMENLAEKIRILMADPVLLDKLSEGAREMIRKERPSVIAEKFVQDFEQMVRRNNAK
jgi:glycosyltransferase involved in cell wall biosynthesis